MNAEQLDLMRNSCRLGAKVLNYAESLVKPGVTTEEIDVLVAEYTTSLGAESAPLNYNGFPKSVCTSVNECICHGVPDGRPLQEGDIINVDVTVRKDGYYGDTSRTFFVGDVSEQARELVMVAEEAMNKGIEAVTPFGTTGDIGFATNKYVTRQGYHGVKEIGGHGIGNVFHGEPFVPSFGKKGKGETLIPWTCITVEPMINMTSTGMIEFDITGSTVKYYETEDRSLSAQFEHTVLITDKGYEILTVSE